MTRHRHGLQVIGAFACLVALVGACGSDDSGDSTTAAPATTGATDTTAAGTDTTGGGAASSGEVRGVTATAIKIGGLGEATTYVGVEDGAKARFERANREGGINGRMIDYIGFKDDGKDPGLDLDKTRELIDSDGVFAVAPVITQFFLPQSSDLLAQNQVPFVGWGFMPGFCGNDYGYGFNGCLVGTDYVNSALVDPVLNAIDKPVADIRVAIQSGDDITGKSGSAQYEAVIEKRGAQVVYSEQNLPTDTQTTDYSPFVQEIIKSEPDVVYASSRFSDVIGLTGALRQAGYDGPVVNFVTYVPGLLDAQPDLAAALEGVWVNSQIPPSESESPAVKQVAEDLQAIGADPFVTLGASVGYWSADVLVQQLTAAGADLTPETFQAAMQDFTYEPLEGGIGPVSFPQDQTAPTPCSALVEVRDKAYQVLEPMQCYEAFPAS